MTTPLNPSDIARETLKRLAVEKRPPTPENYRTFYQKIAGLPNPVPEGPVASKLLDAVRSSQARIKPSELEKLVSLAKNQSWKELFVKLIAMNGAKPAVNPDLLSWESLLPDLFSALETRHAGWTTARKRESLSRVFQESSPQPLNQRLNHLMVSWGQPIQDSADSVAEEEKLAEGGGLMGLFGRKKSEELRPTPLLLELKELFAQSLETILATQLATVPELAAFAQSLGNDIRKAHSLEALADVQKDIKRFRFKLELLAEDQSELRQSLIRLLNLIIENIQELVSEDQWLFGQIDIVRTILGRPLNLSAMEDAEARLKEVIQKQSLLKQGLQEAQNTIKSMLAHFVSHLSSFTDATSDFSRHLGSYTEKISGASDVHSLKDVLQEIVSSTRSIQLTAQRTRDESRDMQRQVQEAEARIQTLQKELDRTSRLAVQDPLTGILNRRGFENRLERELEKACKWQMPLCLAVLDIDNFKKLNDQLGHAGGDAALIHLSEVVQAMLRSNDVVARYGGEEFVVLLPDTELPLAEQVMVRVQRELTRRFFLHDNKKLLITFSCGIALYRHQESGEQIFQRADALMYKAKQTGKNKVIIE